jgi:hypothetical protein
MAKILIPQPHLSLLDIGSLNCVEDTSSPLVGED